MSNQLVITSGAKVRNLEGVLTGTSGVVSSVPLGAANGVATLDSGGKVPVSQLPSSVVTYLGTWDAATNTPTLTNGVGDAGDMYICNVAGTVNFGAGPITFAVGDWVLYGSGTWQKSSGQNGTVTSVGASITGNAIGLTGSPITTAGTIAFNFNGTSGQYVNGAGNLVTFPTTIAQAQRLITEVYNETGATLTKGTVVYINGGHGNLPTVTKAIATGDSTSAQTYGVVQNDITDNNNGYVVVIGSLGDLDTQAYANGTQLYLSSTTAGAWTSTKQYAPAHLVYVGIVVRSHPTQGVVEIRIQNGFELDELHNVSAQTPSNNQGLFYNTSTSLWENKSIATALGYTPADDSLVVKLAGTQTITGVKNFNIGLTLQDGYYPTPATGYVGLGSNGSGITILTKSGVTVYNNNLQFSNASNSYYFPNATGTIALTSDIPSLAGYVPYTGATNNVGLGIYSITASTGSFTSYILNDGSILMKNVGKTSTSSGYNTFYSLASGFGFGFADFAGNDSIFTFSATGDYTYTFPAASGTIALVGGSGVGTVTSVAALTIGTTGTDLSSSVANSTTTPVITLNVPTASATNRGALSSADWTTFNNKQNALTNPVTGTGTTNYLPKFTGTSTIGNSNIQDDGSTVTITSLTKNVGEFRIYPSSGTAVLRFGSGSTEKGKLSVDTSSNMIFETGGYERMRLDASGNLGLGVTPSAWVGATGFQVQYATVEGRSSYPSFAEYGANTYSDSGTRKYIASDYASRYSQFQGTHYWLTAPSGTAGAAISWTQAMTLFSTGNLAVGTTTDSGYKLDVNGTARASNLYAGSGTGAPSVQVFGGASSNSIGGSAYITLQDVTNTRFWGIQADASQKLNFWHYNGGWTSVANISSTGAATFSNDVTVGQDLHLSRSSSPAIVSDNNQNIRFITNGYSGTFNTSGAFTTSTGFRTDGYIQAVNLAIGASFYNSTPPTNGVIIQGNVGVGTSSPAVKFEVAGSGSIGYFRNPSSTAATTFITVINANNTSNGLVMAHISDGTGYFGTQNSADLRLVTGDTERMRITSGGNVLIGTTTDTGYMLRVTGYANIGGNLVVNGDTTIGGLAGTGSRTVVASSTGVLSAPVSDISVKQNIKPIGYGLNEIIKMNPVWFDFIDEYKDYGKGRQNGNIAQEMEQIIPEAVFITPSTGKMGINYDQLHAVYIKAIQEQQAQIQELKQLINK